MQEPHQQAARMEAMALEAHPPQVAPLEQYRIDPEPEILMKSAGGC